ncbi:MAG: hypothetical protein AB8C02_05790, partial [Halioglobus sp.]
AACADSDTSTKIVQNGGTMMLSVGAYEELGHINFDETDITAKITDSNSTETFVKVREVFPLSADRTSLINRYEIADAGGAQGIRNGFSGFWFVVVDLVNPANNVATNFALGSATLELFGLPSPVVRAVEVLAGPGTINPVMDFGGINTLNWLEPSDQVKFTVVDPTTTFTEANMLGALEFAFDYNASDVAALPASQWPRAVSASNDDNLQISSYTSSDAGTNTLHIMVLNPAGIGRASEANKNTAAFYQSSEVETIRFSLVYPPQVGAAPFSVGAASVAGYDIDGDAVSVSALSLTAPTL